MGEKGKAQRGGEGGVNEEAGGEQAGQDGGDPKWVDDACEQQGSISFEELQQLREMGMVLNETLRIYPPVLAVGRSCIKVSKMGPFPPPCCSGG